MAAGRSIDVKSIASNLLSTLEARYPITGMAGIFYTFGREPYKIDIVRALGQKLAAIKEGKLSIDDLNFEDIVEPIQFVKTMTAYRNIYRLSDNKVKDSSGYSPTKKTCPVLASLKTSIKRNISTLPPIIETDESDREYVLKQFTSILDLTACYNSLKARDINKSTGMLQEALFAMMTELEKQFDPISVRSLCPQVLGCQMDRMEAARETIATL